MSRVDDLLLKFRSENFREGKADYERFQANCFFLVSGVYDPYVS